MRDDNPISSSSLIGIWWDNGMTLVALTHSPDENSGGQDWIDSNLNHADEWKYIAPQFGLSARSEYFSIPRGRVLLNRLTGTGLIYHGAATHADRLPVIAAEFRLNNWTAKIDDHYQMGRDVDALFDDWD